MADVYFYIKLVGLQLIILILPIKQLHVFETIIKNMFYIKHIE